MFNVGLGDGDRVAASTASTALGDHVLWHSAAGLLKDVPVGHLLLHGSSLCDSLDSHHGKNKSRAFLNHCIIALRYHWCSYSSPGNCVSRSNHHRWAPAPGAVPPRVHALLVGILGTLYDGGGNTGDTSHWCVSSVSGRPLTPAKVVP